MNNRRVYVGPRGGPKGRVVTTKFLEEKKQRLRAGNWPVSKWILFCEKLMECGYTLRVDEAQTTLSKYVYVCKPDLEFKVRFSNHRPNFNTQTSNDSDFYVGVSHGLVTTTDDAIKAVHRFFGGYDGMDAERKPHGEQPTPAPNPSGGLVVLPVDDPGWKVQLNAFPGVRERLVREEGSSLHPDAGVR